MDQKREIASKLNLEEADEVITATPSAAAVDEVNPVLSLFENVTQL